MRDGHWTIDDLKFGDIDRGAIQDDETLFYHSQFEAALDQVRSLCPAIRHFICLDSDAGAEPSLEAWLAEASDVTALAPDVVVIGPPATAQKSTPGQN